MSNCNDNRKYGFNNESCSSKNIARHDKKSHVEDDEIKVIGIRPEIGRMFSPISRQIEFPQAQQFSERKPELNWNYLPGSISNNYYRGQHYT